MNRFEQYRASNVRHPQLGFVPCRNALVVRSVRGWDDGVELSEAERADSSSRSGGTPSSSPHGERAPP